MTVVDYIKGKFPHYSLTMGSVGALLIDRNIGSTEVIINLTQRERDLLTADALMLIASSFPTSISGSKKKSGDFEISNTGYKQDNPDTMVKTAMGIYRQYSDPKYNRGSLSLTTWIE